MSKVSIGGFTDTLRRYPKTVGGVGILTTCGLIMLEKQRVRKYLSKWVDTAPSDTDKKRPDYIYIKYHIYKESMRKLKQKEEDEKKWVNVIINPIGKWWKTVKHSVAWRLLNIAQTGTQHERLKAVRQLVCIDHLKDWDFRHLAQICDARTAVSLARSGADSRWFVPVHMRGCIKNPKVVLSDFHDMLARLRPNSCIDNFFNKYFPQQYLHEGIDEFFTQDQASSLSTQDTDMLKEIISFLHHITKDEEVSKQIIKEGGLMHLMELYKIFADDNDTLSTLCKVLANMSLVENSVEHFFVSGWIGALAEWMKCPDLRLQVISAKTMANLDHDDPNHVEYPPNVYPLHPRLRTRAKPKADIIFIHGLLGGVFITWRQKDRNPIELGLYGKNAFYTSEMDDVFLMGEQRRNNGKMFKLGNGSNNAGGNTANAAVAGNVIKKEQFADPILKAATKTKNRTLEISDAATMELVETLQNAAELEPEWEVVHPDVPLKANEGCCGEFSVPGNEWQNQDNCEDYTNCWPMEWLPDDYPNTRIIGIDYTSAVTEWSANFTKYCPCEKGQGQIDVRATSLLQRLSKSDIGNERPVVWIGHSMGGILTKLMLMKAIDDPNLKVNQIANSTSAILFLGTPHRGSSIAKWKQHMQMIISPSIEVKEMEEGAPKLLALHDRFMACLHTCFRNVKVVTIAEGAPTMLTTFKFPLRIVTEDSARIDYGDFYVLKDDHLSLSKPIFRQSFLYQRVLKVIEDSMNTIERPGEKVELSGTTFKIEELKTNQQSTDDSNSGSSLLQRVRSIFSQAPQITINFPNAHCEEAKRE
ncbi:protein SERAC1 isoform X2 [Eurosta solidaginis]|uniref:protein SERAC1 isoform X2 n=1 Tax=Eurosta solidaginis TaxID=178769 RepID=UPI003530ACE9